MRNYVDRVRAWTLSIYFKMCRSREFCLSSCEQPCNRSKSDSRSLYHSVMRESFEGKLWTFDELLLQFSNVQSWKKKVIGLHKYSFPKIKRLFMGILCNFADDATASQHEKAVYRAREPTDRMRMRNWNLPAHFDLWNFMVRCSRFCCCCFSAQFIRLMCAARKYLRSLQLIAVLTIFFIALFLFPFSVVFRIFLLVFRWCFFFCCSQKCYASKVRSLIRNSNGSNFDFRMAYRVVFFSVCEKRKKKWCCEDEDWSIGKVLVFCFYCFILSSKKHDELWYS